ncbi:VanZ family protein [Desulfitispora alkaliphila]|uniref:VanZ family protein n=1 Tax=Desulfitispora alkaliphila TaxID=622674 RepID=UPI003D1CA7B9
MINSRERLKFYILYLFPIVLWVGIVLYLSNQSFQQQDIRPFISRYEDMLMRILPEISFTYGNSTVSTENPVGFVHYVFRKGAHILVYGILGLLLVRAINKKWDSLAGSAIFSLSLIMNIAVIDEWNQSLNPNRTGSAHDVILDLIGAVMCIGLYIILVLKNKAKK